MPVSARFHFRAAAAASGTDVARSEQVAQGLADEALAAGTRLLVSPHGDGVYERFERNTFGANDHYIRFGRGGSQKVALKKLRPQDWAVLSEEGALRLRVVQRGQRLATWCLAAWAPAPACIH